MMHFVSALFVLAALDAAHAAEDKGYAQRIFVAPDENECRGIPACLTMTAPAVAVPAAGSTAERFTCPSSNPYVWAWDVGQHEHIQVHMVSVDAFGATIEGVSATKTPGFFVISLGCSTEPYTGSGFLKSRHLAPSAGLQAPRPSTPVARPEVSDPEPDDPCVHNNTPNCQAQKQISFWLGAWATHDKSFSCTKPPYLYPQGYTYAQSGSPSVSAFWDGGHDNPYAIGINMTNWNPIYSDLVVVSIGCTSTPPDSACGSVQSDPQCPEISGSQTNHCAPGPIPVCFQTYQERCKTPPQQRYECTIDQLVSWCMPCPG
ncbi:MAG: hypothetical protein ABIQ78_11040 [Dokdonella sp.]